MEPRIVFLKPKSIDNLHRQAGSTLIYVNSTEEPRFPSNNDAAAAVELGFPPARVGSGQEGK